MIVLIGERTAECVQSGMVGGESVALPLLVGLYRYIGFLEGHRLDVQVVLIGEVLKVQFRGCALRYADRCARRLQHAGKSEILADQQSLSIVVHWESEVSPLSFARGSGGDSSNQHVDFARLDGGAHLSGGDRANLHSGWVAQYSGGYRAAEIDIEAGVIASAIDESEAGNAVVAGADDESAVLHRLQPAFGAGKAGMNPKLATHEELLVHHVISLLCTYTHRVASEFNR